MPSPISHDPLNVFFDLAKGLVNISWAAVRTVGGMFKGVQLFQEGLHLFVRKFLIGPYGSMTGHNG